jgi:ribosome production factor 2
VKTTQPKRVKNIARDVFGEKVGRLHVEKQDLDKIQTRKVKALKKRKRGDDDANDEE